ncbi:LPS export ABC transporter periplasmic protein LptC [Magnetospirillum sp. 15-1]|uniref:LPS export ABC transporter periplasmic protein LptC n=1 Tax=Magnetospirillum sp. 15-1 TaxID=1979370 RepID=UPI000BBBFED3|nr:LPS export ABC transporter periplasmic protein LptC [Magnetospirillum sp. 15-1]
MSLRADTDSPERRPATRPQPKRHPGGPRRGPFTDHSHFVSVMKIALPALAALLLGLVVVWPKLSRLDSGFKLGFANLSPKAVDTLVMKNARYFGIDESNRPFAVTAETATQAPGDQDLIYLVNPKADFTSTSGANIVVDAVAGIYHQSTKVLDLSGGVNLYHDTGYEIHTPTATVELANNSARGFDPVEGHGPQGAISSAGFEITGKRHDITFTGKSQLNLRAVSHKAQDKGRGKGAKTQ